MTQGYFPKDSRAFVDPGHKSGGWSPTNFWLSTAGACTTANYNGVAADLNAFGIAEFQVSQNAGMVDTQAQRLSYVPNEALMPRLKTLNLQNGGGMTLVKVDEVARQSKTILLAEYSDNAQALKGDSTSGGAAFKTHRPTNGIALASQARFDGETGAQSLGTKAQAQALDTAGVFQLKYASAQSAIADAQTNGSNTNHLIVYVNNGRHNNGGNFAMSDGSGKNLTLEATLNPSDFYWGDKLYSSVFKTRIQVAP
jgi:prepilin-type processing-associated H-X9-DG protein